MLEKFEEDLLKNDKGRKENRRGILTICRMQGSIAQTYFMMDQMQYDVARKIYYGLTNAGDDNIENSKGEKEKRDQTRIYTRQTMVDGIGPEQNILESKYKKNKPADGGVIFEKGEEEEDDDSQHAH